MRQGRRRFGATYGDNLAIPSVLFSLKPTLFLFTPVAILLMLAPFGGFLSVEPQLSVREPIVFACNLLVIVSGLRLRAILFISISIDISKLGFNLRQNGSPVRRQLCSRGLLAEVSSFLRFNGLVFLELGDFALMAR